MNVLLKRVVGFLSTTTPLLTIALSAPIDALAGAWVNDKGATTSTSSLSYTSPYKSSSPSQSKNDAGDTSDYNVYTKTNYVGFSQLLEYGLTSNITLIGEVATYYYNDRMKVSSSFDAGHTQSFSLKAYYYNIDTNFGFRQKIYGDGYSPLSYQVLIYPGDLVISDEVNYLAKKFAAQFSLLYGYSFNIPFGTKDRPKYGNYIDLEIGYKGYPVPGKSEGIVNASLGLRPFGNNPLIIVGIYNNFNAYTYTKRPFDQNSINASVSGFGLDPALSGPILSDISKTLTQQGNNPYHQLNFQLGYTLDKTSTLYIESYHSVIKGKPFTNNSYYLAFEYKF